MLRARLKYDQEEIEKESLSAFPGEYIYLLYLMLVEPNLF